MIAFKRQTDIESNACVFTCRRANLDQRVGFLSAISAGTMDIFKIQQGNVTVLPWLNIDSTDQDYRYDWDWAASDLASGSTREPGGPYSVHPAESESVD